MGLFLLQQRDCCLYDEGFFVCLFKEACSLVRGTVPGSPIYRQGLSPGEGTCQGDCRVSPMLQATLLRRLASPDEFRTICLRTGQSFRTVFVLSSA